MSRWLEQLDDTLESMLNMTMHFVQAAHVHRILLECMRLHWSIRNAHADVDSASKYIMYYC